jgi:predicted negative regulator of RcsB-dependent stress response
MADNQNIPNQSAGTSMHDELEARFHWLRQEFLPKQGPKILAILVILVAAAIFVVQYQSKAKANQLTLNEDLGKAFNYLYEGKSDSASAALETFLSKPGSSDLQQAKAALLLGNIQFQHGNLDAAEQSFIRSKAKAGDVLLIKSGAEHGLATLAM